MDVLYLIFNLSTDAMKRMKISIDSMRQKNKKCTICISDTSPKPFKKTLQEKKIYFDKYTNNPTTGPFNRSKTINSGFKDLITSDKFLTSDIDLIYCDNFLEKMQLFNQQTNKIYTYGNLIYLPENYNKKSNFNELLTKHKHLRKWPGCGFFLVDSEKFKDVNGFDEDYRGWGAEDEDFNFRIINHFNLNPKKVNSNIVGLHQYHPPVTKISKEQQKCKNENRQRWFAKKKKCLLKNRQFNDSFKEKLNNLIEVSKWMSSTHGYNSTIEFYNRDEIIKLLCQVNKSFICKNGIKNEKY